MSFKGADYSRFDTTRMAAMPDDAIDLEQLTFAWPGAPALLRIERLRVARGERVFLRGPSGSGKSTLLGLIGGVLAPTGGSVRVLGRTLHDMSAAQRDRFRGEHVGFVFQITGTMKMQNESTRLGAAAYSLIADNVEIYKY